MADLDLYEEEVEEEEPAAAEGTNRTFIILVVIMAGIVLLGICIVGAWMLWLGPKMASDRAARNHAIELTNEAIMAMAGAVTGTVPVETVPPTPTFTPLPPTHTPAPTSTYTPTPSPQITSEVTETMAPELAEAQVTPSPTPTRRITPTPRVSAQKEKVPGTGIGAFGTGLIACGLVFLLVVVRRLRRT